MKLNLSGNEDLEILKAQLRRYDFADNSDVRTDWITYVPAEITGFSVEPPGAVYRYKIIGANLCRVVVSQPDAGTSSDISLTISAPFTAKSLAGNSWVWGNVFWRGVNNGFVLTAPGRVYINAGTNVMIADRTYSGGVWATSNAKAVSFSLDFEIDA